MEQVLLFFFVAGNFSETFLQEDLVNKIRAAKEVGDSMQTAIEKSNYANTIRILGEPLTNIAINQLGDLAFVPFTMFSIRAGFGAIGVDLNLNAEGEDRKVLDIFDASAILASTIFILHEANDIFFPGCINVAVGCIGDFNDLLSFSVPLISLAIYRRKGVILALEHIVQQLNFFGQEQKMDS